MAGDALSGRPGRRQLGLPTDLATILLRSGQKCLTDRAWVIFLAGRTSGKMWSTGCNTMRILVVDDSRTMRMLVIRTLRQAGYGDYEIVEAVDGLDALEVLKLGPVDLVLCDWNMPRMTGLELLQQLRGAGDLRLFGFITSESTSVMRGLAENAGAAFVISKPFTAQTFQSVLGGMTVGEHAAIVHEGLPTVRELQDLLEPLLGRAPEIAVSPAAVSPAETAVTWTYVFPDGGLAAVGAMDLRLAAALSTGFGMLPQRLTNEAVEAGALSPDLLTNLREVLNVLVAMYASLSDLDIGLGEVLGGVASQPELSQVLLQTVGRLDASVRVVGYGGGLLSSVYALRAPKAPGVAPTRAA